MERFAMSESVEPGAVRLAVSGELDMSVTDRLRSRLDALAEPGATVVLDMSKLAFIDSSGLNVLVTYHRRAAAEGWELRIDPRLSSAVQRVVRLMGLDAVFWA